MMGIKESTCNELGVMYESVQSLCYTPETNIILYAHRNLNKILKYKIKKYMSSNFRVYILWGKHKRQREVIATRKKCSGGFNHILY